MNLYIEFVCPLLEIKVVQTKSHTLSWESVTKLSTYEISAWLVTCWPMPDSSNLHIRRNFILPNIQNFPQIVKNTH